METRSVEKMLCNLIVEMMKFKHNEILCQTYLDENIAIDKCIRVVDKCIQNLRELEG